MNFAKILRFKFLRFARKNVIQKSVSDYKMEMLVEMGRDQFKKLIDKGMSVPVALL